MRKVQTDIDIDFANRAELLKHIKHIPAAMRNVNPIRKHPTGIYVTDIPYDAVYDMSNLDYVEAEDRGYFKLDLLNVHVYDKVQNEEHLKQLMQEPNWDRLKEKDFVEKLIHLGNHYNSICKMPEPINSIPRLAMFLACIRPAKKHLIGQPWHIVSNTVWDKTDGYTFKKSHSLAYAQLVVVHMNLLDTLGHSLNESN